MSVFIKRRGFLVFRSLLVLTLFLAVGAIVLTAVKKAEASSTIAALASTFTTTSTSALDTCEDCTDSVSYLANNGQTSTMTYVSVSYGGGNTTVCYDLTKTGGGTVSHFLYTVCPELQNQLVGVTKDGEAISVPPYANDGSTGQSGFKFETASGRYCFTFTGNWAIGCTEVVLKDGDSDGGLQCITGIICEEGPPIGCLIQAPENTDLGCNPVDIPDGQNAEDEVVLDGCFVEGSLSGEIISEDLEGCDRSRTIRYTATGCDGVECSEEVTFTYKFDVTGPVLNGLPEGGDLGCNPEELPTCDDTVTATDECDGDVEVDCDAGDVEEDGCLRSQTFTYSAEDECGNPTSQEVTYTWKVDTEAPVLENLPTGGDLGCNPDAPECDDSVTASDNCDENVEVTCTPGDVMEDGCNRSQTFTYSAEDSCGNPVSAEVTYTWIEADVSVECPTNLVPLDADENCCATLPEDARATASGCLEGEIEYSVDGVVIDIDTYCFPVGTTTVTATVSNECGSDSCTFDVRVRGSICVKKFYDANANGLDDDDQPITGWAITVTDSDGNVVGNGNTGADGTICFQLDAGTYTVTEGSGGGTWTNTTPTTVEVTLDGDNCNPEVAFGNLCLGEGGGHTPGFWSNKNGERIITNGGLLASVVNADVCGGAPALANATGAQGAFANYSSFRSWLLGGNATNMAYMLSVQLTAMRLNVAAGFVDPNALLYVPGCGNTGMNNDYMTVQDLIDAAIAAVCADPYTPSGDDNRELQACLKNALDAGNNNLNFVQPEPCDFSAELQSGDNDGLIASLINLKESFFGRKSVIQSWIPALN